MKDIKELVDLLIQVEQNVLLESYDTKDMPAYYNSLGALRVACAVLDKINGKPCGSAFFEATKRFYEK